MVFCRGRVLLQVLRLSGSDISSDHVQAVAGGFESLLGIMARNKSGVIIKGCIALPAETIKDDQQPNMFLKWDGKKLDQVTARTLIPASEMPPALTAGQRVRAAAKWVGIGGSSATALVSLDGFLAWGRDQRVPPVGSVGGVNTLIHGTP